MSLAPAFVSGLNMRERIIIDNNVIIIENIIIIMDEI